MPKLRIDQREIEVPPGTTVLEAARRLGIEIPTLCYLEGYRPSTSCLVCMVKICGSNRLAPSCGTVAEEGMEIESETEEVHRVRRSALELLLSDHLGDCLAPCHFACPAHMDIPQMLRQIAAGQMREAIATVKRDIALPAVLGRICPAPCEKACRRGAADGPVAICLLKRLVADVDLASGDPYLPSCRPATGKRVAIVGAGPTGLAAAYYLTQQGHACTLLDEHEKLGGRLRLETTEEGWPHEVLDAEIAAITRLGMGLRTSTRVESNPSLGNLREQFDAVLIACGATAKDQAVSWGLKVTTRGIQVNQQRFETGVAGVFAAGNAIRGKALVVRSVADGKEAAVAIGQYLAAQEKVTVHGRSGTGPFFGGKTSFADTRLAENVDLSPSAAPFSTKIGRMEADELLPMLSAADAAPRQDPAGGPAAGYAAAEAPQQAARCLHCDCRGLQSCKLRRYSALYGAQPRRYKGQRRTFQQDAQHAEVLFEPGKCIDCGLCIQIAAAAGEPLGLTFVGRGFDVRVGVPLSHTLAEALRKVAAECIAACPTAALARK